MTTLTIHNIPDDLLEKLQLSALENGLSVEDEAIRRILSTKFALNEREREELMESVRKNRRKMAEQGFWVTEEEVTRAKHAVPPPLKDEGSETNQEPDLIRQSIEDRVKGFRELRERYPDVYITDEQITRAKREGRP